MIEQQPPHAVLPGLAECRALRRGGGRVERRAHQFAQLRRWRYAAQVQLDGHRVVCLSHEAPIHLVRYIVEQLAEAELLAALRDSPIANCSLTRFERPAPGEPLRLVDVGLVDPLPRYDVPTTKEPRVSSDAK